MEIHKIWHNGKLVYDSTKQEKPNNRAPKNIKGDYSLSVHGNKITLVDNVDGTTVEAKCHPEDNFDISLGIQEIFNKLEKKRTEENKEIRVGDLVEIVDPGDGYATCAQYFVDNNILNYGVKFRYGVIPQKGTKGKVVFIGEEKYVIEVASESYEGNNDFKNLNCHNCIYLMSKDGIKRLSGGL